MGDGMTDMSAEVEKHNAQPPFFLRGRTIYSRGRAKLQDNGLMSMTMNMPICEVDEFVVNPEDVLNIMLKGYSQ